MFKPYFGRCVGTMKRGGCGKEGVAIKTKRLLCEVCDREWKEENGKKVPQAIKREHKPTGELALFISIWNTRPHVCVTCQKRLPSFFVFLFSHVLPKGSYPKFRLYDKNIELQCWDCHQEWEFGDRNKQPYMQKKSAELKSLYYGIIS